MHARARAIPLLKSTNSWDHRIVVFFSLLLCWIGWQWYIRVSWHLVKCVGLFILANAEREKQWPVVGGFQSKMFCKTPWNAVAEFINLTNWFLMLTVKWGTAICLRITLGLDILELAEDIKSHEKPLECWSDRKNASCYKNHKAITFLMNGSMMKISKLRLSAGHQMSIKQKIAGD